MRSHGYTFRCGDCSAGLRDGRAKFCVTCSNKRRDEREARYRKERQQQRQSRRQTAKRALIVLALLASPAVAEEAIPPESVYVMPQIPTEAEKIEALGLAYRLNGNSMVGNNRMIDLTDPNVLKADRIVTTVPVMPTLLPEPKPVIEKPVKLAADICARHGRRKVVTGNSWRCR